MSRRNRERRRERQEQKRHPVPPREQAEAAAFQRNFEKQVEVPVPASWPGGCEASLARPDLVKEDLAEFALSETPGRQKYRQFERELNGGLLARIPGVRDWAMEEFIWHGRPSDPWQPLDAFIERAGQRFSEAAAAQLRLWHEARLGFFEVGVVAEDCVTLREYEPVTQSALGPDFRAITLNIGGANFYREYMDAITLTYVAPWAPDLGLSCAMGYGVAGPAEIMALYAPLLGLRQPELMARPLPWKTGPDAARQFAHEWRTRYWPDWLAERLVFPFAAITAGPSGGMAVRQCTSLVPTTPEAFADLGLYLEIDGGADGLCVGATEVIPVDPTSANAMYLAEYRAFRDLVGSPRAVAALEDD